MSDDSAAIVVPEPPQVAVAHTGGWHRGMISQEELHRLISSAVREQGTIQPRIGGSAFRAGAPGLALAVTLAVQWPVNPSWGTRLPDFEDQLLVLVNAHRKSIGVGPVQMVRGSALDGSVGWKVLNMAKYLYLAHDDPPEPDWGFPGRSVWDRFHDQGYPSNAAAGENLAYGFTDPQSVLTAFLSDEGHKANVENPSWTFAAMGAGQAANGLIFTGQDFGNVGPTPPPSPNDHTAPSKPAGLTVTAADKALLLGWKPSTDDSGAPPSYSLYLNGSRLGDSQVTSATVGGLANGATVTVGVDAFDASGNRSAQATAQGTPGGDPPPPPPPPVDHLIEKDQVWRQKAGKHIHMLVLSVQQTPRGLRVTYRNTSTAATGSYLEPTFRAKFEWVSDPV